MAMLGKTGIFHFSEEDSPVIMIYPNSRHVGQYRSSILAKILKDPANKNLKSAFEKATGAELQFSTFGGSIVYGAPSEEAVAKIDAAFTDMEAALTVPTTKFKAILKKNGF